MTIPVDLLVTADTVLTVDPAGTVISDGAIAIRAGEIVAVGSRQDHLRDYAAADVIDAPGCVAMPGWVNTHAHLAMNVYRGTADDVTLAQFLDRLMAAELRTLTEEMVEVGVRAAVAECVQGGTTTALDMYWYPRTARAVGREAGFRLLNGPTFLGDTDPDGRDFEAILAEAEAILVDNSAQSEADDLWVMPHSTYTLDREQLGRIQALAARYSARIHTHAAENAGELALVLDRHGSRPIAVLSEAGLLGPTTVLAHAVELTDMEIEQIATAGAMVAHCAVSNLKLGCGVARVPQLLEAGARVGLGTDGAASGGALDMFAAARMAALLHKGTTRDPTTVSAERAVRLGTVEGARGLGLDRVGSLEPGNRADIQVVLTDTLNTAPMTDPWAAVVYGATAADVCHTVVDGRVLMRDGVLQTIDRESVLTDLRSMAAGASEAVAGGG
jgi:5-methylthioadenosine/S-adenosylhomocysteine deaminase